VGIVWFVAPLIVAVVGILVFIAGVGHFFAGRPVRGGVHFIGGTPLAIGGLALALLGLNTQSFSRLTYEGPVAEISVKVRRLDGSNRSQICELQGDDWVLSGRVQKWKAWANFLGLDATYTLNQLSNMYSSAARGNGKLITSCDLIGPQPEVNQYIPDAWVEWLTSHAYAVDRRFGDANYMPMVDGAVYRVIITQSGFNAEPANDIARKANEAAG
jgi:hypothetical protein